jgi:hypothetical protein
VLVLICRELYKGSECPCSYGWLQDQQQNKQVLGVLKRKRALVLSMPI